MKLPLVSCSLFFASLLVISCTPKTSDEGKEPYSQSAQLYIDSYSKEYQALRRAAAEASWILNTRIQEGDTITQKEYERTSKLLADFSGSIANIDSAKKYLASPSQLSALQKRQLDQILFLAGESPANEAEAVKALIKENADQTKVLFGFDFKVDGKSVSKNDIANTLSTSTSVAERLKAWNASKEVGIPLKSGLTRLRDLRNKTVQGLGYSDFFSYQVSEYGMTREEMLAMHDNFIKEIWPLFRELHTWARYELAKKYKQKVPDFLPAHWLPDQWGQRWRGIEDSKSAGINLSDTLKKKTPEWIVKKGEEFYISLGFSGLPASFWEKSSLYPLPKDAAYKKNNHASAWHIDLESDVRSLMSVETNTNWWETSLHELGHIYYYITYSTPDVPLLLRGGANRAFHEAIGSQMGLASLQKPLLQSIAFIPKELETNDTVTLLTEALQHIAVLPWASGVMTRFEEALYSKNIPESEFNKIWWDLVKKYQGIIPPSARSEEFCDGCTKTHIIDDPAQYYDYAMAEILLFQLHGHVANQILQQDVHATNYWGNPKVGDFLKKMMAPGASVDWREHLKSNLGTEVSAKPMVDYFAPLTEWLKKQNKGRTYTLPESI